MSEIKVGSFYGFMGNNYEVMYVSTSKKSFSSFVVLSNLMDGEFSVPLKVFKENYILVNKPKKQIKLLGFFSAHDVYIEAKEGSKELEGRKIISERIIEVEDD